MPFILFVKPVIVLHLFFIEPFHMLIRFLQLVHSVFTIIVYHADERKREFDS